MPSNLAPGDWSNPFTGYTEQQARLARGYSGVVPTPPFEMTALQAAGALHSTARDLLAFLAASRGWAASRLEPAMTEAQKYRYGTTTPGMSVGLGWHLYTLNSGTAVWHNGNTIGHCTFAGFLRAGHIIAVVLTNSYYDVNDIGFHLLDSSIPLTAVRRPATVPELTLRHYVGRYDSDDESSFMIGLVRGRLTAEHSGQPGRFFTLYPSGSNRFYLAFPPASAAFLTDGIGRATAIVWTQAGAAVTYPRVRVPSSLAVHWVDGMAQLTLYGDTDRDYVIQASTDLSQWVDFSTNTIWDGAIVDPNSAQLEQRFYRVLEP